MLNRRDRRNPNKIVVHITNRTREGLPFIARIFMQLIILGIMARGQRLYNVQICHFLWMMNHYHIILAGRGKQISPFIGYVQGETAKAVRRLTYLFGERATNVWESRFKEQKICTANDVIRMISYSYLNPVKAGLVSKAIKWKGCSSLKMYLTGSYSYTAAWLPIREMKKLPLHVLHKMDIEYVKAFKEKAKEKDILRITPNIWKRYFSESKNWSDSYILKQILLSIKHGEELSKKVHGSFMGMKQVQSQAVNKHFVPEKRGITPFLICGDEELRIEEILSYKAFCKASKEAYKKWKQGIYSASYIYGAYRPGMSILGELREKVGTLSVKAKKKAEARKAYTYAI